MTATVDRVAVEPYELPLSQPWPRIGARRAGWLVRVSAGGATGLGDCAPLPPLGTEDPAAAERALAGFAGAATGKAAEGLLESLDMRATPSARHAVESALCDLLARRAGLPLARWLAAEAVGEVMVNAVEPDAAGDLAAAAAEAVAQGFPVLKVKVGKEPAAETARRLKDLRLPPGLTLRLDANRAWDEAEAERFLAAVADLPIDHVEEPLREPTLAGLDRLQRRVPFALAIDESLLTLGADRVFGERPARRLVIKPMRFGGLLPSLAIAGKARAAGMDCVATSAVESSVGVWASVHLAAATASPLAHGLSTSRWLAADLAPPPAIRNGRIVLDAGPGLGLP